MITELRNHNTENYKKFKDLIFSPNFNWNYYGPAVRNGEPDVELLTHPFLYRPGFEYPYPKPCSQYTDIATYVCQEILGMNDINVHLFYRIAVNMVISTQGSSPKHKDHQYPHENLIVYLNQFDGGRTLVYDVDGVEHTVEPKEDGALIFNGDLIHCHEASTNGKRVALVATFLRDIEL